MGLAVSPYGRYCPSNIVSDCVGNSGRHGGVGRVPCHGQHASVGPTMQSIVGVFLLAAFMAARRIRPTLAGVSAAGRRDSHAAEHEVFTGGEFAAHGRHEVSVAQVGGRLTATAELCSASAVSPHRRPTRPPPAASGHNRP